MPDHDTTPLSVHHPLEIRALLERFLDARGAVRMRWLPGHEWWPVSVALDADGEQLCVDISAVPEADRPSGPNARIRLIHEDNGERICAPELPVLQTAEVAGESCLRVPWPTRLERRQRRDSFRARLRQGMHAHVELQRGGRAESGHLVDISLGGCLVGCAPRAMHLIDDSPEPVALSIHFPDGTWLQFHAVPCHQRVVGQHLRIGLQFLDAQPQHQRIWAIVHEIERGAACSATRGNHQKLQRSTLFSGEALADFPGVSEQHYRTAMAERLMPVVLFVVTQILRLRAGDDLDGAALAEAADLLLALQHEDRQGLLYALACLQDQPAVIMHGLGVAVRLVDLGDALGQPADTLRAVAAAGLIHDLGKVLLLADLLEEGAPGAEQVLHSHVQLLRERLGDAAWIPGDILEAVVEGSNERLDGTGYPCGRTGAEMTGLMKLAAVVDAADTLGRGGAHGESRPWSAIHAHLRQAPRQFDARWVDQYVAHFGHWPVGCLVSFAKGQAGWIEALDAEGRPTAVRPHNGSGRSADSALARVAGQDLLYWGAPRATLAQP